MAASLAMRSTIKCFKPKSSTDSPEKQRPSSNHHKKKGFFSSRKQDDQYCNRTQFLHSKDSQYTSSKSKNFFSVISEVVDGEPAIGIVSTIFQSGWNQEEFPVIEKILRVNHTVEVLKRFEEYRELVKSRAAETCVSNRKERLVADGNEVLRHHGATLLCSLGFQGNSSICGQQSCEVCSIVGSSNSGKAVQRSFCETSWGAHEKMTKLGSSRKAMVIGRVIAGRVAYDYPKGFVCMEDCGFDSLIVSDKNQSNYSEELIVLDPRAVLPCFVVIYTFQ
ncbi:uncharacterized protein LOC122662709 [Telopea speciosissima]|uniref:uncharacterized protein LOC122662709 n=1 Tax=Telopea speciosissima TaxID=54955 RepID=UPI001CC3DAFA|nr:uncharacterized protein LOC122662709 [Telopea speciosissima]